MSIASKADMITELNELHIHLSPEQVEYHKKFVNMLDTMCPIKGCPDLWLMHSQAWFLDNGFKLKYCNYETGDDLLGFLDGTVTKFMEVMHNEHNKESR